MANTHLTLFCTVDGESQSNAFSVKPTPTDTVDDLKDLIKAKKSPRFDDIAADELTLWRVSIPVDGDDITIQLDQVTDTDKKKLGPTTRLSKVFPEELPEDTVHIIVQRPQTGNTDDFALWT